MSAQVAGFQSVKDYNDALKECSKNQEIDIDTARKLYSEMQERKISPNVGTFHTMLNLFAEAGKLQEAEAVLVRMRVQKLSPSEAMYISLFKTCFKLQVPEKAVPYFEDMVKYNIPRNGAVFVTLLKGVLTSPISTGVDTFLTQMKKDEIQLKDQEYESLLHDAIEKQKFGFARLLLSTMQTTDCPFPKKEFVNCTTFDNAKEEITTRSQALAKTKKAADFITFCRAKNFIELDELLQSLPSLEAATLISIIEACLLFKHVEKAQEYLKLMREKGATPSADLYSKVITALHDRNLDELCRAVGKLALEDQVAPDQEAQKILLTIAL